MRRTDDESSPARSEKRLRGGQTRARFVAAWQRRFAGSWAEDLVAHLRRLDVFNAIVLFGAGLLLSALPLMILLSSLADERIDDDLSEHIGLNTQGAHIFEGLFRKAPTHAAGPIVLSLIIALAGTMVVVSSLQSIYETLFEQEHRGWRAFPRLVIWAVVLLAALISEAVIGKPLRHDAGPVARGVVSFVMVTLFFAWSMYYLLAGRVAWRAVLRPALVSSVLWLGLAAFSSAYLSSALISEHRLFGTLGVVFILLTWFIAIGGVIVLGAAAGVVWQQRKSE